MSDAVRETVRDKVVAILAEQAALEPTAVSMEASLGDLGIDSLALVETIFSIEETFDIEVPFNANEPEKSDFDISTVASIVRAVETLVAART
ncbi:acyl carrier protein [Amaricoccus macauensis]|uniref:Acyl carrier protein n=1 Tax=Amaricoccus macauensis TaxID=57001 RepID=A0A840SH07_9RHOB|nr:acyl carrier protein [Amaricoccus macauensis]MBB5220204.1 acyl carrier protein [Amaricoccus macauensis]